MRIIGEFDLNNIRVTVFKMNERLSVKFEYNLLEQTYKFRDGSGINTVDDVRMFCSENTEKSITDIFSKMALLRSDALHLMHQEDTSEFDDII